MPVLGSLGSLWRPILGPLESLRVVLRPILGPFGPIPRVRRPIPGPFGSILGFKGLFWGLLGQSRPILFFGSLGGFGGLLSPFGLYGGLFGSHLGQFRPILGLLGPFGYSGGLSWDLLCPSGECWRPSLVLFSGFNIGRNVSQSVSLQESRMVEGHIWTPLRDIWAYLGIVEGCLSGFH